MDDLVLILESEEELIEKLNQWKDGIQSKGMKVNINKISVMISGESCKRLQNTGRWPCGVCGRGDRPKKTWSEVVRKQSH